MPQKPKIGAHVSVAGGLHFAIDNALTISAECAQIFGSSPRQWRTRTPSKEDVALFKKKRKEKSFGSVFLHAAYLVNLASPNEELLKKSVQSLADHLAIAAAIGAEGLIFHVGSGKGTTKKEALDREVLAMKTILQKISGPTLIMENTAGGGEKIGDIEDIEYLYKKVNSKRVKLCYDTAHGLESGLISSYGPALIKKLFDSWSDAVGAENIVAIHANDSKTAFNSKNDRHENIGEGHIGLRGFSALAKDKRAAAASWILEVPGFDDKGPDKKNIDILKECL